ncbi:excinuclease ABC subunit C [Mycoplasmopsis californica]|uniref:Excinuclease cho n=1 Tax=Mycoplasmopsis equigenitalium TaxID=114883 RepID=A0ABY5J1I4_9BACT|nr:excinuclease ABC subunit UvrC [Mycoplasmopsis equigenitalium]UUD37115.1 excinuclease ABC subunit UvrC [Mycoplasmopsis equigenitalium]VEU69579.1 excinuclease ABC subunit C [Mycoplasmopsis californica]
MKTESPFDINLLTNVPAAPGIYLWKNKFDEVIYVGKAINLKKRMMQYFKGSINSYKTTSMLKHIYGFEFIISKNEKDALLLEQSYIKKLRPKYNILLMDDRSYPYLKIKQKDNGLSFTKIYTPTKDDETTIIVGPFVPSFGASKLGKILESIVCTENGLFIKRKDNEFWKTKFEQAKNILKNIKTFKNELVAKEETYATKYMFEESNRIKKVLNAISDFESKQFFILNKVDNFDAFCFKQNNDKFYVQGIFYRNGLQVGQIFENGNSSADLKTATESFLKHFYTRYLLPKYVVLNEDFQNPNLDIMDTKFLFPQKGELKAVMNYLEDSIKINIETYLQSENEIRNSLTDIANDLNIEKLANFVILDISHTGQENKIGAVNFYLNGKEYKPLHRYYKLSSNSTDDFTLMRKTINNIIEYKMLKNIEIDVIFVDGGKPQITAIKDILKTNNIDINVVGLVKNDAHMTSHIIFNNKEIYLTNQSSLDYLRRIQEQVDARAKIKLNKANHKLIMTDSLKEIPNINEQKIKQLLNYFKSYENIKNASLKELEETLSKKDAKNVYEHFLFKK